MIKLLVFCVLLEFTLALSGSISGSVSDGKTPLSGANVYIEGTGLGTMTDSLGNYKIKNLDVGKYRIIVNYIGYEGNSRALYISEKDLFSNQPLSESLSNKLEKTFSRFSISRPNSFLTIFCLYINSSIKNKICYLFNYV